jgi:GGDEF domain-containing protein
MAIVKKCRQYIRGEDFFPRYGGEDFVIELPGASLKNAIKKPIISASLSLQPGIAWMMTLMGKHCT